MKNIKTSRYIRLFLILAVVVLISTFAGFRYIIKYEHFGPSPSPAPGPSRSPAPGPSRSPVPAPSPAHSLEYQQQLNLYNKIKNKVYSGGEVLFTEPLDNTDRCSEAMRRCIKNPDCGALNNNPNNPPEDRCVGRSSATNLSPSPNSVAYDLTGR